jgi:hypothetical protein
MKEQNYLQKKDNSGREVKSIEELLTEETRKLVGYIMPILEASEVSTATKSNIKAILWNYKNNLSEKLIKQSNHYDKSNN